MDKEFRVISKKSTASNTLDIANNKAAIEKEVLDRTTITDEITKITNKITINAKKNFILSSKFS
jgi:hypothetical protein